MNKQSEMLRILKSSWKFLSELNNGDTIGKTNTILLRSWIIHEVKLHSASGICHFTTETKNTKNLSISTNKHKVKLLLLFKVVMRCKSIIVQDNAVF